MFTPSKKQAEQTAQKLLAGHCGLIAWWALRHAGVFDAMVKFKTEKNEGLNPAVHAARTNMAPDVLEALLQYLASTGLIVFKKEEAHFTPEGQALFDHEDGFLQLVRAYQPVLEMAEHLLAKLKTYGSNSGSGIQRKSEYMIESQASRHGAEVFPAIEDIIAKHKLTHLLDLTCGGGDLLMHVLSHHKKVVGVGIGADAASVRKANDAINQAEIDKRVIVVSASAMDVLTDTQRTFDRIGISRQLWKEFDCVIATSLLGEMASKPAEITRILTAFSKSFPNAHLMLIEPIESPKAQKNYYAAELSLLLKLSRAAPLPADDWRVLFAGAKMKVIQEMHLMTEGLAIFLCRPTPVAAPAAHQPSSAITPR